MEHNERLPDAVPHGIPMFLRMPTVLQITGLGRSTIYRLMAEHKFPQPVHLGSRAIAWRRTDVEL